LTASQSTKAHADKDAYLDPRVRALHDLAKQHPDKPAVYGTAILYALSGSVKCNRSAEEKPLAYTEVAEDGYKNDPTDASLEALSAFDADCVAGERLDPDNAYFPAFRAYSLFAQHRDKEALAELISAGNKPYYREYWIDELAGRMKESSPDSEGRSSLHSRLSDTVCCFPTWPDYET
jgi:hypothetical protein